MRRKLNDLARRFVNTVFGPAAWLDEKVGWFPSLVWVMLVFSLPAVALTLLAVR